MSLLLFWFSKGKHVYYSSTVNDLALKTSLGLFAKWQNKTRVEIMLIEFNRRFSQIEQLVSISMTITHRRGPKLSNFVVHSLMFCPEGWTMWIYQPSIKSSLKNSIPIQFISTHFFYNGHSPLNIPIRIFHTSGTW